MKPTRQERREQRRRNARKMQVSGRSVRLLQEIVVKKAEKARKPTGD